MFSEEPEEETAPQGLPFNNLYLNSGVVSGSNHWWMYLSTVLLVIFAYTVCGLIISLPLLEGAMSSGATLEDIQANEHVLFDSAKTGYDKNLILLFQLLLFVAASAGFYTGLRRFHRKSLTSVLTGYEKFRFKRYWTAFCVWGGLLTSVVVVNHILDPEAIKLSFEPGGFIISIVMCFVLMPVQTGIEEAVFRGYLLQGLSQVFRNGIAPLVISSLLFGLAHMSNPEVQQYGWQIMLTYYVFFALFMGGLSLLDEGLELAMGIHFANNFFSSALVTSPHSVIKTYSVFTVSSDNPEAEIVLWFCMAIVTFTIFWLIYRWKNFNLIIK